MNELQLTKAEVQDLFGSLNDYMDPSDIERKIERFYWQMTGDLWVCRWSGIAGTFHLIKINAM